MKQHIIAILILISLLGCSAKNSASENGAILGTTAGAMAGGVMGLAISASKSEKKDFTKNAIIGAVVVGAIGYMTGSAMGYVVDAVGNQETKEIEKMAKSHKIVNKSLKQKLQFTPEVSNEKRALRVINNISKPTKIVNESIKDIPVTTPEAINDVQISNEMPNENMIVDVVKEPKDVGQMNSADIPHVNTIMQEPIIIEENSPGKVSPIEHTKIQNDRDDMRVDKQENEALW